MAIAGVCLAEHSRKRGVGRRCLRRDFDAEFDLAKTAMKTARTLNADATARVKKLGLPLCGLVYTLASQELTNDRGQNFFGPLFEFLGAVGEESGPSEAEILRASAIADIVETTLAQAKREAADSGQRPSTSLGLPRNIGPRPIAITSGRPGAIPTLIMLLKADDLDPFLNLVRSVWRNPAPTKRPGNVFAGRTGPKLEGYRRAMNPVPNFDLLDKARRHYRRETAKYPAFSALVAGAGEVKANGKLCVELMCVHGSTIVYSAHPVTGWRFTVEPGGEKPHVNGKDAPATPAEVVKRALDMALDAISDIERRGHSRHLRP